MISIACSKVNFWNTNTVTKISIQFIQMYSRNSLPKTWNAQGLHLTSTTSRARLEWTSSTWATASGASTSTPPSRWLRSSGARRRRERSSWNSKRLVFNETCIITSNIYSISISSFTQSTRRSRTPRTPAPLRTSLSVWSCTTRWRMALWCSENSNTFSCLLVSQSSGNWTLNMTSW